MMNLRTCISGVRHLSTSRAVCNATKPGLENYARVVDSIKNDRERPNRTDGERTNRNTGDRPKKKLNLRKKTVSEESYSPGMGRVNSGGPDKGEMRVDRRIKFDNTKEFRDNFASANFDNKGGSKFLKRRTPLDKKVVPKRYGSFKADGERKSPKLFPTEKKPFFKKESEEDPLLTEHVTVAENSRLQAALNDIDFENPEISKKFATLITSEAQPKSKKIDAGQLFKDAFNQSKGSLFNTGVSKPAKSNEDSDFVVQNLNRNYTLTAEQANTLVDIVSGKTPIASLKMKK